MNAQKLPPQTVSRAGRNCEDFTTVLAKVIDSARKGDVDPRHLADDIEDTLAMEPIPLRKATNKETRNGPFWSASHLRIPLVCEKKVSLVAGVQMFEAGLNGIYPDERCIEALKENRHKIPLRWWRFGGPILFYGTKIINGTSVSVPAVYLDATTFTVHDASVDLTRWNSKETEGLVLFIKHDYFFEEAVAVPSSEKPHEEKGIPSHHGWGCKSPGA